LHARVLRAAGETPAGQPAVRRRYERLLGIVS